MRLPATVCAVLREGPDVAWPDESSRPRVTDPAEARHGHPNQELLVQVHAHLRGELTRIAEALDQLVGTVGTGTRDADVGDIRAFLHRMTNRQNAFSVGAFCAAYCRTVATHHAIEDQRMFPDLAVAQPALVPVVDRLEAEHLVIAGMLDALDRALVAMVAGAHQRADDVRRVREAAERLADALGSHLDYEEQQLLGPLGRLPIVI
ncbi:MAG: fgd1 [Nocardioidaceae bacterium]|nr:fgd1 [Nocardioidaceae bacterium]